jgi:glycosyltransferase involved in cell wall biosynthesis
MTQTCAVVDVLVCTKDGCKELPTLLSSLSFQTFTNFHVIIRDESQSVSALSNPIVVKTLDLLARKGIQVSFTRDWVSKGICYARYKTLELAKNEYVWFVDDDVIAEPDCLEHLMDVIRDKKSGYVQGSKVSVDNSYGFSSFDPNAVQVVNQESLSIFAYYHGNIVAPLCIGDTANLLFDRQKLMAVGGFAFFEMLGSSLLGEDWIAAALTADRYGGYFCSGAKAWHMGRVKNCQPFTADRMFVLNYLKSRVSEATFKAVESAYI